MTDAAQPVAGSLTATVFRACAEPNCQFRGKVDCPEHVIVENLGEVASFDLREAASGKEERR